MNYFSISGQSMFPLFIPLKTRKHLWFLAFPGGLVKRSVARNGLMIFQHGNTPLNQIMETDSCAGKFNENEWLSL